MSSDNNEDMFCLFVCVFSPNRTFKIARGRNECGIENRVSAGVPILQ